MFPSFGTIGVNRNNEVSAAPLNEYYIGGADAERYLYIPNWYDQTVSVIDTDTDTVVATITLTASKNFAAIIYRYVNNSIYVFGDLYFNRIDADPSSGTFNTVVEAGASASNDNSPNLTYAPMPLDLICNSGSSIRFHMFKDINNTVAAVKEYNIIAPNTGNYGTSGLNLGQLVFGHAVGWVRVAPKAGLLFFRSEQSYKYRILHSSNAIQTNGPFTFVQESWQMDLDRLGLVGNGYIFDNMVMPGTSGSTYKQIRGIDTAPLGAANPGGSGGVSPSFAEYCPINGKGASWGLYIYAGKTTTSVAVIQVGASTPGGVTLTDMGDLVRTSYKATNETGTDAIAYNHRNKKLYVRGYSNSVSLPGVCNLIHVYDMSQPTVADMETSRVSITVGDLQSALKQHNCPTNNMIFNQTKYYDADGVLI